MDIVIFKFNLIFLNILIIIFVYIKKIIFEVLNHISFVIYKISSINYIIYVSTLVGKCFIIRGKTPFAIHNKFILINGRGKLLYIMIIYNNTKIVWNSLLTFCIGWWFFQLVIVPVNNTLLPPNFHLKVVFKT